MNAPIVQQFTTKLQPDESGTFKFMISFRGAQRQVALELREALLRRFFPLNDYALYEVAFIDWLAIRSGQKFKVMYDAARTCTVFVALVGGDYPHSPYTMAEVEERYQTRPTVNVALRDPSGTGVHLHRFHNIDLPLAFCEWSPCTYRRLANKLFRIYHANTEKPSTCYSQPYLRPIATSVPCHVKVLICKTHTSHERWYQVVREACLAHKFPRATLVSRWAEASVVLVPTWAISLERAQQLERLVLSDHKKVVVPFMLKTVDSVPDVLDFLTLVQGCEQVSHSNDEQGIDESWVKHYVGEVIDQFLPPGAKPGYRKLGNLPLGFH